MVAKQHPFIRGLSELVPHPSPLLSVSQDKPEDWFDFKQPSLWIVIASIVFNPLFWNIVARQVLNLHVEKEYHNKLLTKLAGGRPYLGCYLLAVTIFSLGILRDHLFQSALAEQPNLAPHPYYPTAHVYVALALFLSGQILVITSMLALGVTGTYLGDYFGILMSHRVTSFPFNVVEDPMYIGSTLCFFGTSIWYRSPAGIAISVFVFIVYQIALRYEGPFTAMIYSAKDKKTEEATPKAAPVKAPVEPVESSPNNSPAYRTRSRARKVIDE
ncbi:PEMT-domain-containing protein [Wallemia mellicola]|nr:PEMT-domain-containing protein [Wallemia mellicola]